MNIQPYIILNNKDSRSITGLLITSLPPITKPQVRTQIETVDGRSGDIVTPLGFEAYDKPLGIGLTYDYDIDEIIEFFNSSGVVTFSNEPDKYYRYAIYEKIDFEKLIRFKTAEVVLHVQPYKFSTTEEPELFDLSSGVDVDITNSGNTDSRPDLLIIGSGDIDVSLNDSQILSLELGEETQPIIISSEDMNAYGAQSAIQEVKAEIVPNQDLHGYSQPWSAGAGKNKLPLTNNTESRSGITCQTKTSGELILSGTATETVSFMLSEYSLKAGSYILNGCIGGNWETFRLRIRDKNNIDNSVNSLNGDSDIFTIANDTTVQVQVFVFAGITVNYTFYPMVRLSSVSDPAYEPYENICEISGYTELNVMRAGVNLLDEAYRTTTSNNIRYFYNGGNGLLLKGGVTYTVGVLEGSTHPAAIYLQDYSSGAEFSHVYSQRKLTYTPSKDIYCKIDIYYANSDLPTEPLSDIHCQVELGSEATEYKSYSGSKYNIELVDENEDPLTVYGGELNVTTGEIIVNKKLITRTWSQFGNKVSIGNNTRGSISITSEGKGIDNNPIDICNIAPYQYSWSADSNHFYIQISGDTTYLYVFLPNGTSDNTEIQVCYELAAPIAYQLTPTQINNLLGENNLFSDVAGGDISARYKSNGVIHNETAPIVSFTVKAEDMERGVLLNRLVTGDYDKIRLKKGENTLSFTGNALQLVIDKYSRWI